MRSISNSFEVIGWLLEHAEDALSLERLHHAIRELADYSISPQFALYFVLLSVAFEAYSKFARKKKSERLKKETAYFRRILRDLREVKEGTGDRVDCIIHPQRGTKLIAPPHSYFAEAGALALSKGVRFHYYFVFESLSFSCLNPDKLKAFLVSYRSFAEISLILLDDEKRKRFGISKVRRNMVAFLQKKVAYTHGRDEAGNFVNGRRVTGADARKIRQLIRWLKLLSEPDDSEMIGSALRDWLRKERTEPSVTGPKESTPEQKPQFRL